jgi:heme-degrading monooxygenase HmoA
MAIKRIWHGWTTKENAEAYRSLLEGEVRPGIEARKINGFRKMELLSRDLGDEVEFMTIITFDSLKNVIEFQGEQYARAYIPDAVKAVLSRWDTECAHFETFGDQ